MYIEPNTNIILLKNAPINSDYKNTLWFNSANEQVNYFKTLTAFDLKKYTYQRVNLGVVRVGINAERLYSCNYMMFQNLNFGNKWFYAFITKVEYVNNNMSNVYFDIDVMQTWFFDYELKECFVEREHTKTDGIGDNIVAESLGTDDYIINKSVYKDFSEMQVLIYATGLPATKTENGVETPYLIGGNASISCGVLNGMLIYQRVLDENNIDEINRVIDSYVDIGLEEAIQLIQEMPIFCGIPDQKEPSKEEFTFQMNTSTLDGYTPRNKKLFTYPYNFLVVSNNSGSVDEFQFEYFTDALTVKFNFYGVPLSTPIIDCVPKNYRGIAEDFDSGITLSNFPQCSWIGDSYNAWVAQNKGSIAASYDVKGLNNITKVLVRGISSLVEPSSGSSFFSSAIGAIASPFEQNRILDGAVQDAKAKPDNVYGKIQCDSLNVAVKKVGYTFMQMCIHKEHAKSIDDYFTMYGYATKKIKIPNTHVRENFTFTKTADCTIIGELPSDDISKICSIYNRGITFWTSGDNVGNYSISNNPI